MNNYIKETWMEFHERGSNYDFLRRYPLDNRVWRLFAVACCREIWDKLTDERSRKAVEVAEFYADGLATEQELKKACNDASYVSVTCLTCWAAVSVAFFHCSTVVSFYTAFSAQQREQQGLIIASMYPVAFNDNWITSTTKSLAQQIYNKKDFHLMPILADALQDVDCNEGILSHLRGNGPFYKGNYIIDVLIGKR